MLSRALIIDEDRIFAQITQAALKARGFITYVVNDPNDAIQFIEEHHIDIVLLDVVRNDINGYKVLEYLMSMENIRNIPVIVMSEINDAKEVKRALDNGALDYIRKPFDVIELVSRIESALRAKQRVDLLNELAQRDGLTQLYNRHYFNQIIEKFILSKNEYQNGVSLVMIDLDYFKSVNDKFGHIKGDEVLVSVANAFDKSTKAGDILCRYGGEEFCIILPDVNTDRAYLIAERVRENVSKIEFNFNDERQKVTISCGISHTDGTDNKTSQEFINETDTALYMAKDMGRNQTVVYQPQMFKKED